MHRPKHSTLAFIVLALGAAALLLYLGRGTTYFYDDWWFVTQRMEWTPHAFLEPHNEHLSALPVLVYKAVLEIAGLDAYWLLRVVLTLLVALCAGLVFAYSRRRIGDWPALALTFPFLVFGSGSIDLLWPFQIGFLGSLAFGVGALLAIDSERWKLATLFLVGALSCSALGIVLLLGIGVELAMRQKAWVAGVPGVLFGAWYAIYGASRARLSNFDAVPGWLFESLRGAALSLTDMPYQLAGVAGVLVGGWLLLRVAKTRAPRLAALLTAALAFWTVTALGRAHLPDVGMGATEPRYLYPGALLLALAVVESLRGVRVTLPLRRYVVALAVGVLVLAGISNGAWLIQDPGFSAQQSRSAQGHPPNFSATYARAAERYR